MKHIFNLAVATLGATMVAVPAVAIATSLSVGNDIDAMTGLGYAFAAASALVGAGFFNAANGRGPGKANGLSTALAFGGAAALGLGLVSLIKMGGTQLDPASTAMMGAGLISLVGGYARLGGTHTAAPAP